MLLMLIFLTDIEPVLLKLYENVAGIPFFETQCRSENSEFTAKWAVHNIFTLHH